MSFEELQVVKDIDPLLEKLIDIGYPEESANSLINLYQNKNLKWQIDPFDYKSLQKLEQNVNVLGWLISLLLGIILALRYIRTLPLRPFGCYGGQVIILALVNIYESWYN